MSKVLVGRDATVFSVAPGNVDLGSLDAAFAAGVDILGVWKEISVEMSGEWVDVTPSSGSFKERRRTTLDWNATLTSRVRNGGSILFAIRADADYVGVSFTEESGGKVMTLFGGIESASWKRQKDEAEDTLKLICVFGNQLGSDGGLTYG